MSEKLSRLEQLRAVTEVVADTGDMEAIRQYTPTDATTNPSLILAAAKLPMYRPLIESALANESLTAQGMGAVVDHLAVMIGCQILEVIPGRISTEVDARLSFNTQATIDKAKQLIDGYEAQGVSRDRVLIKMAATWEGIKAAEMLEKEGINCNLTLLFSFAQAVACAEAGVFLISPFVGRIYDWYKGKGEVPETHADDRGVLSVKAIYEYYKQHGYKTVVMGASFRNTGQIAELAGCDRLTISPSLLEELANDDSELPLKLKADQFETVEKLSLDEATFRWMHNEDAMATEKLAEGIRKFAQDQQALENLLANWS
ncbi:transaldolase [Marinibactrum halimedae]|uniref:Transaldolase n=1 Tax=Marinibactrum halimedae TaxID=1444977 RepID=A0AA37WMJ7_9GAMM|nr:transaldolase [Marinibactrum halimedae]MCD9461214.1 transaldolase [Marinibactrum halimedae]GLS25281.1 transaldolase [Marinibactrum halimedae]